MNKFIEMEIIVLIPKIHRKIEVINKLSEFSGRLIDGFV